MKKALLYGLSAVMLLSLTACGTAQANQPDEPDTTLPSAVQTEPPQETVVPSDKPDNMVELLSANGEVAKEVSSEELHKIFELGYQNGQDYKELGLDGEDLIIMEITEVQYIFEGRIDITAPLDLEEQYRAWRAENYPDAPVQEEIQLFEDCNSEIVYALDQVNIRASYSVGSDKLGSLSRGQSITRIGIGINDAEGWSKVQLSDGTIAYMVSSYLSTTKPTTQTKPSSRPAGYDPNDPTWNPNTEADPLTDGLATKDDPSGYDPNYDPDGDDSGFEKLDDPWAGQAEIDFSD